MKRFFTWLILTLFISMVFSAGLASTTFCENLTYNSGFPAWTTYAQSSGANWHFTWDTETNISSTRRAVIRIKAENGQAASATWVYTTKSTNYHPYNSFAAYGRANTAPSGHRDDRDNLNDGTLTVKGTFYN